MDMTVEYWFEKNDVVNHANAQDFFTPRGGLTKIQDVAEGDDSKKSYKRLEAVFISDEATQRHTQ